MKRRNLLRNFIIFIFAFIFGYTIKKEGQNMVLQRINSTNFEGENGKSIIKEIRFLAKQAEAIETELGDRGVNVKQFGAIGDGITNDTKAIKKALASLRKGQLIIFPTGGKYLFNETLIFDGINVMAVGCEFIYNGNVSPAIQIGNKTEYNNRVKVEGLFVRKFTRDWANNIIGILFINNMESSFYDIGAENFYRGIVFKGNGKGTSYNRLFPSRVYNNRYSLVFTSDDRGWANENTVIGGRFSWSSIPFKDGEYAHLVIEKASDGYVQNNIKFYGCSLEDGGFANGFAIICAGNYNSFHDCRFEGAEKIKFLQYSKLNIVSSGYGLDVSKVEEELGANSNTIISGSGSQIRGGTAKNPTLTISNDTGNTSKVFSVINPMGTETVNINNSGDITSRGVAYYEKGFRFFTSDGTCNDRGIFQGAGSPEGVVTARTGSIYLNRSGGAGTTMYVKEKGTTNTGWVAK
ncbi:glycosyl hydrolase family 28-related protein [Peribacillus simplex]|uniref:Rhamnogalacturonase A/B/Epimerase-like pectate lyase domain-containing protein n=1 Tax=Peribacillus simplex NBRC 15720 = DSM 1321 TaxID=1349754 RepID=A0A223ELI7_9BACI|nr:glycosyl hydrolase family 28-related protein [Peribacillus simplex]ASS96098.1 hypothetical protein BS1321_20605 [Peribacillus simplex NBRC 15720 = DSM 1321]MEC1397197.1 glycosyl hydrolase family 28-related protein [Peribacillus simplex]